MWNEALAFATPFQGPVHSLTNKYKDNYPVLFLFFGGSKILSMHLLMQLEP